MAQFQVEGRVIRITDPEEITTERGLIKKRFLVIQTEETFPKMMAFVAFDRIAEGLSQVKPGDKIKVIFAIESREYNNRWYTDLRLRDVRIIQEKSIIGGPVSTAASEGIASEPVGTEPVNTEHDLEEDFFTEDSSTETDTSIDDFETEDSFEDNEEELFTDDDTEKEDDDLPF